MPEHYNPPAPISREEARLRLVCAALTGLGPLISSGTKYEAWARDAIGVADACPALLYPEPEEERGLDILAIPQ